MEQNTTLGQPKRKNVFSWLLWWQIDPEELNKQINEYDSLKITQSARGISLLLTLLSGVITLVVVLLFQSDLSAFFDVIVLIILGIFIYKGFRWAAIVAMIMWTLEKILGIMDNPSSPFIQIVWWTTYMHTFYLAFKVEQLRHTNKKEIMAQSNDPLSYSDKMEAVKNLEALKNNGTLTEEEFNKSKKEILGT